MKPTTFAEFYLFIQAFLSGQKEYPFKDFLNIIYIGARKEDVIISRLCLDTIEYLTKRILEE